MSGIQAINSYKNRPLLNASNTGYIALTGICATTAAGITKNKTLKKCHKYLGYTSAALTLLHLGIILHNRNEWKKKIANTETENIIQKFEGEEN